MALQEQTTTVNGKTVRYWQDGTDNGRAIVLIHGGLTDAKRSWSEVMPALADEYHVIAPDLPGFGKSAALDDVRPDNVVQWLKLFLDTLGLEQAVIVGSSFGGLFARLFSASYPTYVPALVLINGGTIPDIPPLVKTLGRLPVLGNLVFGIIGNQANSRATLERTIHVKSVLSDDFVKGAAANARNFAQMMRMAAIHPFSAKVLPPVPTLLLWGANDTLNTTDEAEYIKSSIAGAKLNEIEDCGHLPQLETPDVFVWQIKQFLTDLSRPRKTPGVGQLPQSPT